MNSAFNKDLMMGRNIQRKLISCIVLLFYSLLHGVKSTYFREIDFPGWDRSKLHSFETGRGKTGLETIK